MSPINVYLLAIVAAAIFNAFAIEKVEYYDVTYFVNGAIENTIITAHGSGWLCAQTLQRKIQEDLDNELVVTVSDYKLFRSEYRFKWSKDSGE